MEPFEVSVPRDLRRLRGLRHQLAAWLDTIHVPAEHQDAVVLAVHEAAANAIEHAGSRVSVRGARDQEKLIVVVSNTGRWTGSRPAEEVARGRGFTIMRGLMSYLDVSRDRDRTTIRLRLDLPPVDGDASESAEPRRYDARAPG